MNSRQTRIFELVLVLSIAFLPSLINSLSFVISGRIGSIKEYNSVHYITWIAQSVLSISLLFYVLFKNNRNFKDIGLKLKFDWKDLLVGAGLMIIAGVAAAILAGVINIFSPDFIKNSANPQNIEFINSKFSGFLIIILIIVPLQEELIVRGFTMSEIFNLTESKSLAIIISVLLQFSYHLYQGIGPAIFLLPFFIISSIYFVRTGNLNPVIYSHILMDLISLIRKT